jgi:enoyl-[acyl-carrier protein] reductase III
MSNEFELKGRTVLVTGGTRGIGRAISLRLARAGAKVVANYARNDEAAATLQAAAVSEGLALEVLRADLTLPKGLSAVLERMAQPDEGVISLVHCAATGVHRPIDELTTRHLDWTMTLNARVFFELLKGLLPSLSDGSTVVALSSAGAVRAVPAYAAVGMSKGALESLARHAAAELAPRGIRVNILAPGSVATEAWAALPGKEERLEEAGRRTPLGRLVSLEEVSKAAQFLVCAASSGIVGHTLVVDGGRQIME